MQEPDSWICLQPDLWALDSLCRYREYWNGLATNISWLVTHTGDTHAASVQALAAEMKAVVVQICSSVVCARQLAADLECFFCNYFNSVLPSILRCNNPAFILLLHRHIERFKLYMKPLIFIFAPIECALKNEVQILVLLLTVFHTNLLTSSEVQKRIEVMLPTETFSRSERLRLLQELYNLHDEYWKRFPYWIRRLSFNDSWIETVEERKTLAQAASAMPDWTGETMQEGEMGARRSKRTLSALEYADEEDVDGMDVI
eukprot:gnl/Spiro4/14160_TR7613_c0_g1_i1.p1 gnl/Spiro4/14160_TR7613_c0_g1~~gnl/Spiro4/14160_TR7613_c0_g1_i1.p1  ORF type:complete len:259 (-),score=68.01 gnl/Spiro4/14160_TR7613_c0_g1_i1:97-873(-)